MNRKSPINKSLPWLFSLLALVLVAILNLPAGAQEPASDNLAYVDNLTITVRRGPGLDYKIIAFLSPGRKVQASTLEAGWRKVVFDQGKTGWVLERFLTKEASLLSLKETLLGENNRLKTAVTDLTGTISTLKTSLETPVPRKAGPVQAKPHVALELARALALAKSLLKEERVKVKYLQEQKVIEDDLAKWFLIGSGISGLGMVLGVLTYRSRRWFKFKL